MGSQWRTRESARSSPFQLKLPSPLRKPGITATLTERSQDPTNVLKRHHQAVSMQLLNETSGVGVGDHRYCYKLKERLIKKYTDSIIFITIDNQNPKVVISVAAITGRIPVPELIGMGDDVLLKKAAFLLRQHILAFVDKVPSLPWPPTVDTLLGSERQPPEEVTSFISHVLTSTNIKRAIRLLSSQSLSQKT